MALAIPWMLPVGPMILPTYRVVLLLILVPCLVKWASGKAGKPRAADWLVLAYCAWCALALVMAQGLDKSVQSAGMLVVETCGAYFLARCYVRTSADFWKVARLLFWVIAFLLPFALIEAFTGSKPLINLAHMVLPALEPYDAGRRAGLWRVQGPFEHSILFGVFCGAGLAMTFLVYGRGRPFFQQVALTAVIGLTATLSLSSGAIMAVVVQCLLLAWNWALRSNPARWRILWLLAVLGYVAISLTSNQSVIEFFISRFAFDKDTAYFRLLIWYYGTESVAAFPWFGVGFGEWLRPYWMPPSIDMFWLVPAVRHGAPAALLMMGAFWAATLTISFRKGLDATQQAYRTGYLIVMTGWFLVGWTVHFWNGTYVLFVFLLGSGMWLLDATAEPAESEEVELDRQGRAVERRPSRSGVRRNA